MFIRTATIKDLEMVAAVEAQCFLPDFMRKGLDILLLHHTVFHQLGVAGDGMKRRF